MGRSPCCQQVGLKKGPWTPEEDQKLIAYVKEHGHGNWRALPKNCGLLRCGKSCRLRWTNYLRPDIKRGLFSDREEQTIIQLHALVGNKWAFIASQLPNRTDNEIKNYWNTVLKKRVEKGLTSLIRHQTQKWDDRFLCKKSHSSSTISKATTSISSHLAQWESVRLEAEARLVKESKQSQTFKASLYMSAIPSYHPPHTISHASQKSLGKFSFPDQFTKCQFSYLTPSSKSTINPTCNLLNFFSSSIVNNRTSLSKSLVSSSESLTTSKLFPPQGSLTSTLKLGLDGKLSWNTQELSFRESHSPESSSPQQNSHIDFNKCQEESSSSLVSKRDSNDTSAICNPLDASSILNLHDILFEVENSSSNGVTEWEGEKDEIEEADDAACKKKNAELDDGNMNGAFSDKEDSRCILDLENLHLFHFDTLVVDTQHNNNYLINDKETMCNSPCSQILSYPTSILG